MTRRNRAATIRTLGWVGGAAGVVGGGLAGLFAYLGSGQNDTIQSGGLPTSADILVRTGQLDKPIPAASLYTNDFVPTK